MIKLAELRWRRKDAPSDILVGRVGSNYLWVKIRKGTETGFKDAAQDEPYAEVYLSSRKPFNGPDVPEE